MIFKEFYLTIVFRQGKQDKPLNTIVVIGPADRKSESFREAE
jgi:hypothetical protein